MVTPYYDHYIYTQSAIILSAGFKSFLLHRVGFQGCFLQTPRLLIQQN